MCDLCRAFGSEYGSHFHSNPSQSAAAASDAANLGVPAPAYASVVGVGATGNQNVDGLLSGYRWSGTLTYSFPDSPSDYPSNYGYGEPTAAGFAQISAKQQAAVHNIMAQVETLTNLDIEYAGTNNADIRLAQSSAANPTAYAYYPNSVYSEGGDVWFGTNYNYTNPKLGDYYYLTHIHELGHSLGLKHGQSLGGVANTALPGDRDALEFSVMTYRSYVGGPTNGYTNEAFGYPQSFMMNDILALQTMYGADYTFNSGATVYSWSSTTGETFVDGEGQGRPGDGAGASANRVFITVWDGGGEDTYDFSNYTNSVTVDLRPGYWSTTSSAQKAYLGDGHYAQGNVYNAYLFNGDARSYIENAIGGSGNDALLGNAVANRLDGGLGNDTMTGGGGDDVFVYHWGGGADIITDFLAGAGTEDQIDLVGFIDVASFAEAIEHAYQSGANTVFDFGLGFTLTLLNVFLSVLAADDFTFEAVSLSLNEAPTEITVANLSVLENAAGATVGNVTVSDPDDTAFTFTVSDSRFQVVGSPGAYQLKLKSGVSLDYETSSTIEVTVTATDSGGLSVAEQFSINVVDAPGVTVKGTSSGDVIDGTRSVKGQMLPTADDDTIFGMAGDDTIRALGGNDYIDGGAGNDKLYGEGGDDTFAVSGSEAAGDTFSGGSGTDKVLVVGSASVTLAAFNAASSSIEVWQGNGAAILGNSANNVLNFAGLTAVSGLAYVDGGSGNDTITGTMFADDLRGGAGNDTLYGGFAADVLIGGAGADKLYGEDGDDVFVISGIDGQGDTFVGGSGEDKLRVAGSGNVTLAGFNATVSSIELWEGNGAGLVGTTAAEKFDLSGLSAVSGLAYVDGGSGNDVMTGTAFADDLRGGAGNDTLYGGMGDDLLTGGAGADKLYGDDGDDTFFVSGVDGQGDTFAGGAGSDTLKVTGTADLVLTAFNASASSIEEWEGNGKGLVGTNNADTFDLSGLGAVSGLAYVDSGNGNDTIIGSVFADNLRGGAGNDVIKGGDGNDVLRGAQGVDSLTGGGGSDRFEFSHTGSSHRDSILDYSFAEGDTIDLSTLLVAQSSGKSTDAARLTVSAANISSSNIGDYVRLSVSSGNVVLQVDVDGATGSAKWADVALLSGYASDAADQVLVQFQQQAFVLSI